MLRLLVAGRRNVAPCISRYISSTPYVSESWMDKMKGMFTGGQKDTPQPSESFTLLRFAEELSKARKLRKLKQFVVGKGGSDATFADAFEKQEAIIRCLGFYDQTGENIQTSHKKDVATKCNCTIVDVENALAKFTWAKQAQQKIEQLKAEGKPMPKSLAEVQKLMGGSSPLDIAQSNLAKSGQISRNAPCPCGSKKLYKRCCGKDKSK
ncbi:hypothetical protein CASFOL_024629 [Castilleja foliolosa]|uniref:Uncharacterized protein n=1 Tax=Castilleja foliolosa TaxID=1961234 RepID=A0ABD3CSG4_9LAMI